MKLTGKHRAYGSVLALGVIALTVDRMFLQPDQTVAGRLPAEHYAVSRPMQTPDPGPESHPVASVSNPRAVIADRLEDVARARRLDLERVPDAFVPPTEWLSVETPEVRPANRMSAETFERTHVLTGVMAAAGGGYAIIDGKTLFIGMELDGFTLVSVSERSALLESDGERVELMLRE
jgi:hypothetical protein